MTTAHPADHRAAQRYGLAVAATLDGQACQTLDLSASGILLESVSQPTVGARVSLLLHYRVSAGADDCRLACEGEVVRVEPHGDTFSVAVSLDHPLFPSGRPSRPTGLVAAWRGGRARP